MQLVITIRKEVPDVDEGTEYFEWVKEHLAERPELKIAGHLTNHFEQSPPPEVPG